MMDLEIKLERILKDQNLYRLLLSDKSTLLCDEDDILNYYLVKDKVLNQDTIMALKKRNDYYVCLNNAISIVNYKQYSIKQVRDKLKKNNHSDSDVDLVIEYLVNINVLDDQLFYEAYVDFKKNQGYGPIYIKNKLYELGIDLEVYFSQDEQISLIEKMLNRAKTKSVSKSVFGKKFKSKMLQQGFDVDLVVNVLANSDLDYNDDKIKEDYLKLKNKLERKYNGSTLAYHLTNRLYAKGYTKDEINKIIEEEENARY